MPTQTPNYNFNMPIEGSDDDTWGGWLNGNWTSLDNILAGMQAELDAVKVAAQIAVGDLYFSADATDPAAKLGYGTWAAHAAGSAIVGVGTADGKDWVVDQAEGEVAHQLITGEMPSHTHSVDPPETAITVDGNGNHTHSDPGQVMFGGGTPSGTTAIPQNGNGWTSGQRTGSDGWHTHSGRVNIGSFSSSPAGSGTAHNNIQPSIAVYIWKRTA